MDVRACANLIVCAEIQFLWVRLVLPRGRRISSKVGFSSKTRMARSAEKAMTALARWRAAYVDKINEIKKRPHFAGDCEILKDAMYFRRQVVHEISRKIAQIQNPSLGEYKLRDLNDEINKLIREKDRWDVRIKELGGPDYREDGPKLLEKDGKEVPGNRGYRYFGAARDLPGVRELFEDQPQPIPRKTRGELMKSVDISYYGNCDEDDGVILPVETAYEEKLMAKKAEVWRRRHADEVAGRKAAYYKTPEQLAEEAEVDEDNPDDKDIYDTGDNPADTELLKLYATAERDSETKRLLESEGTVHASLAMALSSTDVDAIEAERELTLDELLAKTGARPPGHLKRAFVAHASIPSQKEVEEALVEKRKRELLEQYMTPEFIESIQDTGKLLGVDKTKSDEVEVEAEEKEEEEEEEGENAATVTMTENEGHAVQDNLPLAMDQDEDCAEVQTAVAMPLPGPTVDMALEWVFVSERDPI
ncbi:Pre-mRNA-splicing factor ISY1 [Echinococcus granulosus]|uniref:Pre-mRNA-splicing factor ISY1 n=1 Tax=Echinococcus granulosus TaxID=6210 RepID=W6UGV2_ECHGR|nr:Pre-mRNA-splicing factor ISY1 [Echinococcus granulosus]EUB60218.1 Pre-mRNA-splicing factor ISY1 [Echinococcus granulosus]